MLTGVELGTAIGAAIKKKGVTQKEVAAFFGVKPPSIQDWIKRGTISKDKLPGLWAYFEEVAGPEHWGLDRFPPSVMPVPRPGEHTVSESQWQLLQDFEMLIEEDKHAIRETLKQKAGYARRVFDEMARRVKIPAPVPDRRVEETFGPRPDREEKQ